MTKTTVPFSTDRLTAAKCLGTIARASQEMPDDISADRVRLEASELARQV